MNWKNRLTNYNFWISIFSAVLLILQALKIEFDIAYVNEIFTAVLGLLVVIGIISDPTRTTIKNVVESKNVQAEEKITAQTTESLKTDETTEKALPIVEENEVDNINIQNDFQAVLNKISSDLEIKIKEIAALNEETAARLVELQQKNNNVEVASYEQDAASTEIIVEDVKPAVAEMENPYIDLMN